MTEPIYGAGSILGHDAAYKSPNYQEFDQRRTAIRAMAPMTPKTHGELSAAWYGFWSRGGVFHWYVEHSLEQAELAAYNSAWESAFNYAEERAQLDADQKLALAGVWRPSLVHRIAAVFHKRTRRAVRKYEAKKQAHISQFLRSETRKEKTELWSIHTGYPSPAGARHSARIKWLSSFRPRSYYGY